MKRPTVISDPLSKWDIVVVPFPYSDRLAEKRRPALIISKPWIAKDYGLLWVAMITSLENDSWNCDIEIKTTGVTGLTAPSVIRPVKIATIEAGRVLRKIGRLAPRERKLVVSAFAKIMG